MLVEHGGHGQEESVTDILATLFLVFLLIPAFMQPTEDAIQAVTVGEMGHLGHH